MKNTYLKSIIVIAILATTAFSCIKTDIPSTPPQTTLSGVDIVPLAYLDTVDWVHRWHPDDRIAVATFFEGRRVVGSALKEFHRTNPNTPNSGGFKGTIEAETAGTHTLYAISLWETVSEENGAPMVTLPAVQRPMPDSYDPKICIALSEPKEINLPAGTSELSGIVFTNHQQMSTLRFRTLIAEPYASERVLSLTISDTTGRALAGTFAVDLENTCVSETAIANASDTVVADYSEQDIKLGDLTCWVMMAPGDYGPLAIKVKTEKREITYGPRSGLKTQKGKTYTIRLTVQPGRGDVIGAATETLFIDRAALGIEATSMQSGSTYIGEHQIGYFQLRRQSGTDVLLFGSATNIYNRSAFAGGISEVRVETANPNHGAFVRCAFGDAASPQSNPMAGNGAVSVFTPAEGTDPQFFRISSAISVQIKNITVIYKTE